MAEANHWMPLYVADYLADTGHLSAAEHGAYFLLMMQYWRLGSLPADDAQLRNIVRLSAGQWDRAKGTLLDFFTREGEVYRHKRLDAEREMAAANLAAKSARAHAGARGRWTKNAPSIAQALPEPCSKDAPLPSPSPGSSGEEPSRARESESETDSFEEFWKAYGIVPNASKPDARRAWAQSEGARPDDTLLAACVRAYRAHLDAQTRREKKPAPICHPSTWLNGRRWESFLDAARDAERAEQRHAAEAAARKSLWNGNAEALAAEIGDGAFSVWFASAQLDWGPPIVLRLPKVLKRDYVRTHYLWRLERLFGGPVCVEVA
jgi:uncharacterized protein YdaU (DUF1376 family)